MARGHNYPRDRQYWTGEEVAALRRAFAPGGRDKELAREIGIASKRVLKKRQRLGLLLKPDKNRWWTKEREARLRKFVELGHGSAWIANRLGTTKSAVDCRKSKLGLYSTTKYVKRKITLANSRASLCRRSSP